MALPEGPAPTTSRLRLLLPVLAAAWLVAVPLLGLGALGASTTFLGERPTSDDLAATGRGLWWAAGVALGVALLGTALSVRTRSRAGVVVFALLLLASVGLGAVAGVFSAGRRHEDPPRPTASTGTPVCRERSGGGTDCPGG